MYKYDGSNNITNRYTQNLVVDDPLALQTNEQTYYYLKDALGTITGITDNSGNIVQKYEYDSFGNITSMLDNNSIQPYTFTGREYDDETGLYFYRARMYDAKIGRFISKDPISFAGGDVNLFRMVLNNPVNWIDPMGLAAYMCTKPLDALGGAGQWVYQYGTPLLYHQYICVKDGKTTICGGQDRAGGPYSPGKPSNDHFDSDRCEKKDDRTCMDKCLTQAIQNPNRPAYGLIGPGTNCQEWANDTYATCVQKCKGK